MRLKAILFFTLTSGLNAKFILPNMDFSLGLGYQTLVFGDPKSNHLTLYEGSTFEDLSEPAGEGRKINVIHHPSGQGTARSASFNQPGIQATLNIPLHHALKATLSAFVPSSDRIWLNDVTSSTATVYWNGQPNSDPTNTGNYYYYINNLEGGKKDFIINPAPTLSLKINYCWDQYMVGFGLTSTKDEMLYTAGDFVSTGTAISSITPPTRLSATLAESPDFPTSLFNDRLYWWGISSATDIALSDHTKLHLSVDYDLRDFSPSTTGDRKLFVSNTKAYLFKCAASISLSRPSLSFL